MRWHLYRLGVADSVNSREYCIGNVSLATDVLATEFLSPSTYFMQIIALFARNLEFCRKLRQTTLHRLSKSVAWLVLYKLKKAETDNHGLCGTVCADNPTSKSIYDFASNLLLTIAEMTYFHVTTAIVITPFNEQYRVHVTTAIVITPFNEQYRVLINICICLKNTLHKSY